MIPKLYQYGACPFCHKVRSILRYKGADFEAVEVHPLNKKEIDFSPDYRAVPIYIDSKGTQVNDSTPIMRWIDDEFPERKVFRTEPRDVERENRWLLWSDGFVKGLPAVIYETFPKSLTAFDYITKVGKFSWIEKRTIQFLGAFAMTLVAKKIKKREQIINPEAFLKQKAEEWISGLEGRPFMGGDSVNGADLAVHGIFQSVANLPAGRTLKENGSFNAWLNRVDSLLSKNEKKQVLSGHI